MDTNANRKRCQAIAKSGEQCTGFPTRYDPDYCIFHSRNDEVKALMQAGRRLGAEKPERRQRLSARNLGFTRINSTKDLLAWVNRITSRYYTRQIDSETLKDLLSLAAAFSKILEVREVSEEVERLKDMIEEMEGEDGEIQEFEKRDS